MRTLHPHPIEVQATSAAEAIASLQLIPALANYPTKHSCVVDGFASRDALYDRTDVTEIHLRPVLGGAGGKGGVLQTIIGIIIVAVGIYLEMPSLVQFGASMILGGVLQMLAPQPHLNGTSDEKSRYLGAPKNTVAIGTRIPMIYGRRKAWGHYISFDIDSGDLNKAPASWYASPYTDNGALTNAAAPAAIPTDPPEVVDGYPESMFNGLSYPASIEADPVTYLNFTPAIELELGEYDANFATGQTLHVINETAGSTLQVIILGGDESNVPALNTPIIFTRNYG